MQCDDMGVELPSTCLTELDSALNELGMLATRTNSRHQYLNENRSRQCLNMVTINTRYVSNVSIGFQVRPAVPHVRYKPYKLPKERHRTKSENNDNNESTSIVKAVVDTCVEKTILDVNQLKKAKSLESILIESNENVSAKDIQFENTKELEIVSNSIQNLKVVE